MFVDLAMGWRCRGRGEVRSDGTTNECRKCGLAFLPEAPTIPAVNHLPSTTVTPHLRLNYRLNFRRRHGRMLLVTDYALPHLAMLDLEGRPVETTPIPQPKSARSHLPCHFLPSFLPSLFPPRHAKCHASQMHRILSYAPFPSTPAPPGRAADHPTYCAIKTDPKGKSAGNVEGYCPEALLAIGYPEVNKSLRGWQRCAVVSLRERVRSVHEASDFPEQLATQPCATPCATSLASRGVTWVKTGRADRRRRRPGHAMQCTPVTRWCDAGSSCCWSSRSRRPGAIPPAGSLDS